MAPKKAAKAALAEGAKPTRRSPRKTTATTATDERPSKVVKKSVTRRTNLHRAARSRAGASASTTPNQFDDMGCKFVAVPGVIGEHRSHVTLDESGARTGEETLQRAKGVGTARHRPKVVPSSRKREPSATGSKPASPAKRGSTKKRPLHGSESDLDGSDPRCVDISESSEARLRKQDNYGRIMRFMWHEGYLLEKYGKDSPEYRHDSTGVDKGEGEELTPEDRQFCLDKGRERAWQEEIPHVHESGIVMSQADRSSRGTKIAKKDDFTPLPAGRPSKEGHGTLISPTNEEFLKDRNGKPYRRNYFFETMPAKEIWHRNMPPFFTFGETPYMEKAVSREIEDDLKTVPKVPEAPKLGLGWKAMSTYFMGRKSTPEDKATSSLENESENLVWSMWNLPPLTAEEKRRIELRD